MDRDSNLLFGVFAVQLGKITPQQLAVAAGAWAADPNASLGSRLVEDAVISEKDREFIDNLVREAIRSHEGDAAATLASVGGDRQVYQSFAGSIVPTDSGNVETVAASNEIVLGDDTVMGVYETPGRYTLRSEYARGGMGRVLLVHDVHIGRDVALKELLPEIAGSGSGSEKGTPVRKSMPMIARFLQEAKITGQLEHPSIVPVYELGTRTDGSIYYTMKLVRGKTLAQATRDAANLQERLALLSHFVDLCNAVAYAHSRGVIHRDLKPGNVMVGEFGETVVLDWGLAKAKDQPDQHADGYAETIRVMNMGDEAALAKTQFGHALGTPAYMPPEQAAGDLDHIDERSDVYSLGAILYELVAGTVPFEGSTLNEILRQVLQDRPGAVDDYEPDAPRELIAITSKAMAKDPQKRYSSAKALAQDIERFQSGAMVEAHSYGAREYANYLWNRYRTPITAAVGFTVLLVVFGLVFTYALINSEREAQRLRSRAEVSLDQVRQKQMELEVAVKNAETARKDADKARNEASAALKRVEQQAMELRSLLYPETLTKIRDFIATAQVELAREELWNTAESQRSWEWGYYANVLYPELLQLEGHTSVVYGFDVSTDDRFIATASADGTSRVWDFDNPGEALVIEPGNGEVYGVDFDSDADRVALASLDGVGSVWDRATGERIATLEGHEGSIRSIEFSSDGKQIVTASDDGQAIVWDAASGAVLKALQGHKDKVWKANFVSDLNAVVTTSSDNTVKIWNVGTGETVHSLEHEAVAVDFDVSADNQRIVTACYDGIARMWDLRSGTKLREFDGHSDVARMAVMSLDDRYTVVASADSLASIWDNESGSKLGALALHTEPLTHARFCSSGTHVVTSSFDGRTIAWDTSVSLPLTIMGPLEHDSVLQSIFILGDRAIITAHTDHRIRVWASPSYHVERRQDSTSENVSLSEMNKAGDRIVTVGNGLAYIRNALTAEVLITFGNEHSHIEVAGFNGHDNLVATTSDGNTLEWASTPRSLPELPESSREYPDTESEFIARLQNWRKAQLLGEVMP